MINKPQYLIIHHSGGTDANPMQDSSNYTVAQCNADHKSRFNMLSNKGFYVAYHYFIDKEGVVTQTRNDDEEGCHTFGYNNRSLGICLAGNFDATLPTSKQIVSLTRLELEKSKQYAIGLPNIVPHREFANKTCYGIKLTEDWARNLIKPLPTTNKIKPCVINASGDNIKLIQTILSKYEFKSTAMLSGVFDKNMAKSVLYFQLENEVSDYSELVDLMGEKIGPKTATAMNKLLI